ncbi:AAA family ATPase [Haloparvum sedimenti]|uniref:AAA family ATPase n=1 Tax=Haloparvum sedimenti TaxID=1678448 RepID=UPI00071E7483|nr:AAA family ATPase [Haloparvum sedimenti]
MAESGRPRSGVAGDEADADSDEAVAADPDATAAAVTDDGPALVVVCGLPGVGKTTVARRVAEHVDGEVLRTDAIRKQLFPDPDYTDAETERVYGELIDRAAEAVADGGSIVLDATFAQARFREDVRAAAAEHGAPFRLVKVECEESVVEDRIAARDGLSDADFEIHQLFREEYDPLEREHAVVDNSGAEATTRDRVDDLF